MATVMDTSPTQLSFPWMQTEELDHTRHSSFVPLATASPTEISCRPRAESPIVVKPTIAKLRLLAPSAPVDRGCPRMPVYQPSVAKSKPARLGEVRIGNVMLSLLRKYGITDQEIAEVLDSIAQEQADAVGRRDSQPYSLQA